jgi:hypothetical protein
LAEDISLLGAPFKKEFFLTWPMTHDRFSAVTIRLKNPASSEIKRIHRDAAQTGLPDFSLYNKPKR